MSVLPKIKLYATHPHPCSYLPDEQATTLFVDPDSEISGSTYQRLSELGFRRSGTHHYRPHCEQCSECLPVRLPVNAFRPSRRQKRIARRNADVVFQSVESIDSDAHYELYSRYIQQRHADGDMYPPSVDQYRQFLVDDAGFSLFYEMRLGDELIGVNVTDQLPTALSAIYTFFDPDHQRCSPGNLAILRLIEQAQSLGLEHLYLGYWIQHCMKMSYKIDFRPIEILIEGRWRLFE